MNSRFWILSLALFALFFTKMSAQVDGTINPIGIIFGDLSLGADFVLTDEFSLEGSIGIRTGTYEAFDLEWATVPIMAVGKYYFNPKNGADGFYADAFLRFLSRNVKPIDDTNNARYTHTRFGLGIGIGYKVLSSKNIVFDIGFGVGRPLVDNVKFTSEGEEATGEWFKIMSYAKLGVGYRFGS